MDFWDSRFFNSWIKGWIIFGRFIFFYLCLSLVGFIAALPIWLLTGKHDISVLSWYIQPFAVIYFIVVFPFIFFVAAKLSGVSFKRKHEKRLIFKSNLPGGTINGIPPDHHRT